MPAISDIADAYVDRFAELHPVGATYAGIAGHDDEMTDYSPDGVEARADLARSTLGALAAARPENDRARVARDVLTDELSTQLRLHDADEWLRNLNTIASPFQNVKQAFDLMPTATDDDWHNVAVRLRLVGKALSGYRTTLRQGMARGVVSARRQALESARQARVWTGATGGRPYFRVLLDGYSRRKSRSEALERDLEAGFAEANEAYADMGRFFAEEYAPKAEPGDPVGRERYLLHAGAFCGKDLDLEDTYLWGWDQLMQIEGEMHRTAERILPGAGLETVKHRLNTDPDRIIQGVDRFRGWMQELVDRTTSELNGRHFEIPGPVKRIEAMIAPPGGALAMYYTGPSEDFSRPGRMWWPVDGKTSFPLWEEITTVYHEGVPGHHFQVAYTVYLADRLTRYQRLLGGTSGHAEGWALYAERLMAELGYLENPDYYMGMLAAQALRAGRVVVDIGMHLQLEIPIDSPFHPGERWTPDLALRFMVDHAHNHETFIKSEIDRYLGWPGQAISYKVGERVWLAAREAAKSRLGPRFDLKEFHTKALELGNMGLATLERELARA